MVSVGGLFHHVGMGEASCPALEQENSVVPCLVRVLLLRAHTAMSLSSKIGCSPGNMHTCNLQQSQKHFHFQMYISTLWDLLRFLKSTLGRHRASQDDVAVFEDGLGNRLFISLLKETRSVRRRKNSVKSFC